jgi:hypothetical protein
MSDGLAAFYEPFGFTKEDKPWEDHGLVGAHHLHTLAEDLAKKAKLHSVDQSIKAVGKHNCQTLSIDYEKEPLSALLVLCDALQAWRRPQFPHFSVGPAWMMAALAGAEARDTRLDATCGHLVSNLAFEMRGGSLVPAFSPPLVLRLEYDGNVSRDSFVFNLWLDMSCNLQRVDFRKLPYDIVVQIVTPVYRRSSECVWVKQVGRLRDAAWETHMAYLARWLELTRQEEDGIPDVRDLATGGCCTKRQLCYHVQYDKTGATPRPEKEMISFSLRKMSGKLDLVTETMSRFRSDLKGWKDYQEDRMFIGDHSPWHHGQKR